MKTTASIVLLLALATAAHASIVANVIAIHEGEPVPDTDYIANVYDIVVTVEDDDFNAAGSETFDEPWAAITEGPSTFYDPEPPAGASNFFAVPGVEFDTFFAHPDGYPNTPDQGAFPTLAGVHEFGDDFIIGDWAALGPEPTNGTFVIARLTAIWGNEPSLLEIDLDYGGIAPGIYNLHRTFIILPEPGMAALLVLGALVALRRR